MAEQEPDSKNQGVKLLGILDVGKTPCAREAILHGAGGSAVAGLVHFLATSRVQRSFHVGMAGFMVTTLASCLLLSVRGQVFRGDCNFERPYSECGYSQGNDDDFDWEQVNTKLRPSADPWIPASSAFMMVNTSGRFPGHRAQLVVPQLKENDTHCLIFQYYGASGEGSSPGQLYIFVKENNSPLGFPVWNSPGPAFHTWGQV
ncbi:hypothetical protein AMELA_G00045160 [Ameiurus melas]|uniref:Cytochrome c oxidase assembly protein COX20, mitochondrial n=1 Tax=Ameiurus melas TaxID=219545 RepID=A0A7J6B4L5_AMEME|nr:hypothetical protein AMELA_G00045160 [Ameiurus melas]